MKTSSAAPFTKGILSATLIGLVTFTCMPAKAAHELIYVVDQFDNLFSFYSDSPGSIINVFHITGVQNGEAIRGIDYYTGTIYGMGSFGELYTINPNNGQATMVGAGIGVTPNGTTFGVDNGPAGFQIVGGNGQSLLVDRFSGVAIVAASLAYAAGDPLFGVAPRVDALAYDPATGVWYADDTLQNTLAAFNPATGLLHTIGPNGIDASSYNGMDVSSATGIMYMGTPAAESDPQANLYTIDKETGQATLVGPIGHPGDDFLVRGLTVVNSLVYSQTNSIVSIVDNSDGSYTLNFQGTQGAKYYVVTSSNAAAPMSSWTVVGTTNTAGSGGQWQSIVTQTAPAFYRSAALNPQP
jgi:hypothetical protein